jgi:hypothetical protein
MDVSGADLGSPAQTSPAPAARIPSLKWLAPAGSPRRQHGAGGKGQEAYHASGAELALLVPGARVRYIGVRACLHATALVPDCSRWTRAVRAGWAGRFAA